MCFLRSAWSDCGKNYNRDKSTCSLFRLHASVYLLDSLSACLSVCVHTALFQVSSRGRAERSAAAACLLFFSLRTGGASFRTNSGLTTDSRNPPLADRKRSPHFLFAFSLLSLYFLLYFLFTISFSGSEQFVHPRG